MEIEGFNGESKNDWEEDVKGDDYNSGDIEEVMFVFYYFFK